MNGRDPQQVRFRHVCFWQVFERSGYVYVLISSWIMDINIYSYMYICLFITQCVSGTFRNLHFRGPYTTEKAWGASKTKDTTFLERQRMHCEGFFRKIP